MNTNFHYNFFSNDKVCCSVNTSIGKFVKINLNYISL